MKFEDCLWIENQLKAQNDLMKVCTSPEAQPGVVRTFGLIRGQTEFQGHYACLVLSQMVGLFLAAIVEGFDLA